MKFSELSSNSTVLNAKYEKGVVSFLYHDNDTNNRYLIKIRCPRYRSCFFSMEPVGFEKCGKAVIDELKNLLNIDNNGKYIIEKNSISSVMSGSIIALGLKAGEFPYLASIRSVGANIVYIAVPVKDESDIALELLD